MFLVWSRVLGLGIHHGCERNGHPPVSEAVWNTGCERGGRDLVQRFSSQQVGW